MCVNKKGLEQNMIQYNMRYRGPYEYEKFILNVYQFHNEMLDIENSISDKNGENFISAANKLDEVSEQIKTLSDKLCIIKERKRVL